ncbi:MAG: phosphocholine cytidylyltransferase family protein [Candidatus Omnitrophota bacterium]
MKAIILAAGLGRRLRPYTKNLPKCLIEIKGKAMLERQINLLRSCGVKDILVVCGFQAKKVKLFCRRFKGVEVILNPLYAHSNSVISVWLSMSRWNGDLIFMNSDILLDKLLLERVIQDKSQISVLVKKGKKDGYRVRLDKGKVIKMAMDIPDKLTFGVYSGITKIRYNYLKIFGRILEKWLEQGRWNDWYEDVVSEMAGKGFGVKPVLINSLFWHEIDTPADLASLRRIIKK